MIGTQWSLLVAVMLGAIGFPPIATAQPAGPEGEVMTLWVGAESVRCVGVGPRTCLRVRREPGADWELFYDAIQGFDHEPGVRYELLVRVRERRNPPADASSLRYELVEVRSRQPVSGAASLAGTAWQLAAFADGSPVARGREATLELDAGATTVSGFAGCNRYSGTATLDGTSLSLGPLRATLMACPPGEASDQERRFLAALAEIASFVREDDTLRLTDIGGRDLLTLVPRADATLEGVDWAVVAVNNGRQAVTSVVAGSTLTARFEADRVQGSGGCNTYQASYVIDGDELQIGPAAATRRACPAPEGVMTQEAAFLIALTTAARYRIERDTLELRTAEGALAVRLRRADTTP